jgi:hypothetical protein
MVLQLQLQLDLTPNVVQPRRVPALILPPDLIDASASARVIRFNVPVVITQGLRTFLRPEDGPLDYHKRLLSVLEIAHLQFTMGGKKPSKLWFDLTVHFNNGDTRIQQTGIYTEFFGVYALVIGFPQEVE